MSNLTRYDFEDGDIMDGIGGSMVVSIDGEYVKFDDIKELLNSSHNRLSADKVQALPKGQGTEIAALVKQDIESRAKLGDLKYGERFRAFNGRNALLDAYQEALDLCMYLRQELEERSSEPKNQIVGSNKPCDYCTGALDRKRCESCDALTMNCFIGRRLAKPL